MERKRKSIRLKDYDYSSPGAYLVTICTYGKGNVLGGIGADDKVMLNGFGEIVKNEWLRTRELRANVDLDEFVIMPDHFHGIVVLSRGTLRRAPTPESFSNPVHSSLPTIVRYFKGAVTSGIRRLSGDPGLTVWQRGYHEHVIRDNENINAVREYILNNPVRWALREKSEDK